METAAKIFLVGGGGFLGANLRYWLGGFLQHRLGTTFPWETFVINVSGSFVIGLFYGLFTMFQWNLGWRQFVAIGILGGFTTFSSFAYEALNLLRGREYGPALFYIEGSAILTVFGAWLGLVLARVLSGGRI